MKRLSLFFIILFFYAAAAHADISAYTSAGTTFFTVDVNDSGSPQSASNANTPSAVTNSIWVGCATSTAPTNPMYIDDILVE